MMTSGDGQYHTNELDNLKPNKKLTPYITIDWSGIQALVDHPQEVDKPQAQWLIPSSLPSRTAKAQEATGYFHLLWADLDSNPPPLPELATILEEFIGDGDYEIYNTKSATEGNQKARVLIPLTEPLRAFDWSLSQEILNSKFQTLGIKPDPANMGCSQLCYLPNKGKFYSAISKRDGVRS